MEPLSILLLECLPHISMLVLLGFFCIFFPKQMQKKKIIKKLKRVAWPLSFAYDKKKIWDVCVQSCNVSSDSTDACFSFRNIRLRLVPFTFCDCEGPSVVLWVPHYSFDPNSTGNISAE